MNGIAGIVFDLDGTLYSRRGLHARMALALWSDLAILRKLSKARRALHGANFERLEEFRKAQAIELGRRAGISPEQADSWYREQFLVSFVKLLAKRYKARAGLKELLTRLRDRGIKLAVVSDFGAVAQRLEALDIPLHLFDEVASSEDFGVLKPSAVPFESLAKKWGVETSALIVVGDRLDLDGGSAQAANADFLGVRDGLRRPDERFVNWAKVAQSLDEKTRKNDSKRVENAYDSSL